MDKYGYAWEKFHQSMHALTGGGSLQDRMKYAVQALHTLKNNGDFPSNMGLRFQSFWDSMTSIESDNPKTGSIEATIHSMGELQLSEKAREILSMYDELCRYKEPIGE